MNQVFNLILMAFGLLILTIPFIEKVILRPVHRTKLQSRFEAWWKAVKSYSQIQLALGFALWTKDLFDDFFGAQLLSKRVLIKSAILANSILIITLSWIGFADAQPFGVTPWKNYSASILIAQEIFDSWLSGLQVTIYGAIDISNAPPFDLTTNAIIENKATLKPIHVITNEFLMTIGTNNCVVRLTKMAALTISQIQPLGHGGITIGYRRDFDVNQTTNVSTNVFGNVIVSKNPLIELRNDILTLKSYVVEHDKRKYVIWYSIAYFCVLFSVNTLLFMGALMLCRITLRELVSSRRLLQAIALVLTDIGALIILAISLLIFMTLLANPILWLLIPPALRIAQASLYTFCVWFFGAAVTLWIMSGVSAKLVALIALLPNVFAAIIGAFSVLAIKWKKAFYLTVSGILIRCIENGPLTVILGTAVFVSGLIAAIAKLFHLTSFL